MKNKNIFLVLLLAVLLGVVSCNQKNEVIKCTLKGTVVDRDSDTLLLYKGLLLPNAGIAIPITDNKFEYVMESRFPVVYNLTFQEEVKRGSWKVNVFFIENGTVNFTLHSSEDFDKNIVEGGGLNVLINNYKQKVKSLFWNEIDIYNDTLDMLDKEGKMFSERWNKVMEERDKATTGQELKIIYEEINYLMNTKKMYTPEAERIMKITESIFQKYKLWDYDYIAANDNLWAYYKFLEYVMSYPDHWDEVDTALVKKVTYNSKKFSEKYPDHPYTVISKDLVEAVENVYIGGRFVDFSANNVNDEEVLLSNVIKKNKFVLLDLWSTFCGSCIQGNKYLIPVYNEFKDYGFEIVGVGRGHNNDVDKLKKYIEEKGYPWINLIEDGKKESLIWDKYGLSRSGGGTFLINSSGKILEINPSEKRLKEILEEYQLKSDTI